MTFSNVILGGVAAGAFIGMLSIIGEQDYQEAKEQEAMACEMVEQGRWPSEVAKGYDC